MLCASLFPAIIGSTFPGAVYMMQDLKFRSPSLVRTSPPYTDAQLLRAMSSHPCNTDEGFGHRDASSNHYCIANDSNIRSL